MALYSCMKKPRYLLELNWLVITVFNAIILYVAYLYNPEAVSGNLMAIGLAVLFIFGAPLWLPAITLCWHFAECLDP